MATQTPELDTRQRQAPDAAHQPHPSLGDTAIAWVQLAGATAVANLVVLGVAAAAGADMTADLGGVTRGIGPVAIVAATVGALLVATFGWALVAHRVPAFAHLWVPLAWGVGLVSVALVLGASGVATGTALTVMHLLATAVAAHAVPRRLPH